MANFNTLDIISIQECLEGYKKLIDRIEPEDDCDIILRDERLRIITHLINKTEVVLRS